MEKQTPWPSGIRRVIDRLGSRAAVARVARVSREAVRLWELNGYVPRKHIDKIHEAVPEVTKLELAGLEQDLPGE